MGDVYVHVIGAVDEIWMEEMEARGHKIIQEQKKSGKRNLFYFFFAFTAPTQEHKQPTAFPHGQM